MGEYIDNLDVIRIVATIGIVFHHYQQIANVHFGYINFYGGKFVFGYLVELFFIISGFLTEYTFNESKTLIGSFIGKLKRYYMFAALACIFSLVTALVYYYFYHTALFDLKYDPATVITSFLLIHTGWYIDFSPAINNPTWYLCVLTLCYLIYYIVYSLFKDYRYYFFLALIILMIPIYYYVTIKNITIPFMRMGNVRGYTGFFTGCLLCVLWRKISVKYIFVLDVALAFLSCICLYKYGISNWYVLCYLVFPCIIITAVILPQFKSSIIKTLGGISFEVYLWHVPVYGFLLMLMKLLRIEIKHTYTTMFLFCVIVWLYASVVYFKVENH